MGSCFLIACGGSKGTLKVTQEFNLFDRKGKTHVVSSGEHEVTLNFKENKHRLIIKFDETDESVEINTPENFTIPENGTFQLIGKESGQQVDINGDVSTKQIRSPEKYGREQCQYVSYEQVCTTTPQGTTCHTAAVQRWGWQDIRYYDLETHQKVNAQFASDTVQNLGIFNSYNIWSQQQVTYRGICGMF